jgi:predicted aspartyl protease
MAWLAQTTGRLSLIGMMGLMMGCGAIADQALLLNLKPTPSPPISPASTPTALPVDNATPTPLASAPEPSPEPTSASAPDYFREAVNRATSAVAIGQSAHSTSDWQLAASRWQQAIDLMKQVPPTSANHGQAQAKAMEYQQNLIAAQQRATGQPVVAAAVPPPIAPNGLVAQIPIQERRGGTPVVSVTLQGQQGRQSFPMLFDTGATGTLITAAMAQEIGVVVVSETRVKIADGSIVTLPVGYVDVLEVGGLRKQSMLVAIGGSVGLLGQDVYGEFGIAMGSQVINLHK